MAKKVFYWITGILLVISLLLGIAGYFLNPQVPGGEITLWTLVSIFLARPLFNACLGAVSAVKLLPKPRKQAWRLTCLIGGSVLLLIFAVISILEFARSPVQAAILQLLRQFFRAPGYFLIPGVLLGLGLFEE